MPTELHLKHRPGTWEEFLGATATARSIQGAISNRRGRSFLLHGPPGLGKTTLARLIGLELKIDLSGPGYLEIDAATRTGVDDVRDLKNRLLMAPLTENRRLLIVMDEAHALSKSAWNALLKDIEEPPDWVWWVLCTTELNKVPAAIRSRCLAYRVAPFADATIAALLSKVARAEQISLDATTHKLLVAMANGSPRSALIGLAMVADAKNAGDIDRILETVDVEASKDVADFCRALSSGGTWTSLVKIVRSMENPSAEAIRNVVCAWFTKIALNSSGIAAERALAVLDAFRDPYPAGSSLHPLLLSIGKLTFGGG